MMNKASLESKVVDLRRAGKSYGEISRSLGIGKTTVSDILKKTSFSPPKEDGRISKKSNTKMSVPRPQPELKEPESAPVVQDDKCSMEIILNHLLESLKGLDNRKLLADIAYIRGCQSGSQRTMFLAMAESRQLEKLRLETLTKIYDIKSQETQHPTRPATGETLQIYESKSVVEVYRFDPKKPNEVMKVG